MTPEDRFTEPRSAAKPSSQQSGKFAIVTGGERGETVGVVNSNLYLDRAGFVMREILDFDRGPSAER